MKTIAERIQIVADALMELGGIVGSLAVSNGELSVRIERLEALSNLQPFAPPLEQTPDVQSPEPVLPPGVQPVLSLEDALNQ